MKRPPTAQPTTSVGLLARSARRLQAGFTLIEIMVVVVIIGLLAAVVVPKFLTSVDDARVSKAKQDVQAMVTALTMYKLDNYVYPTTDQGLNALVQKPDETVAPHWRQGGYFEQQHLNKDPWHRDYVYVSPGTHGNDYDLYSLGADGQPGGEKYNADIGNWNLDQ
ncbi:MAG: type II secretion system major pseudopilin GspG [Steroidobacteraceae bacterium]